jgi:hypothetical protein
MKYKQFLLSIKGYIEYTETIKYINHPKTPKFITRAQEIDWISKNVNMPEIHTEVLKRLAEVDDFALQAEAWKAMSRQLTKEKEKAERALRAHGFTLDGDGDGDGCTADDWKPPLGFAPGEREELEREARRLTEQNQVLLNEKNAISNQLHDCYRERERYKKQIEKIESIVGENNLHRVPF